jgi:DNA-binding NtrC family response regulator
MNPWKVLVVDHDECFRMTERVYLQRAGSEVRTAANGLDALAILAECPQEVVVMDLKLPDMSGLELLRRIRSEYPDTAVLVTAAQGTIETTVEAIKAGAEDFISKTADSADTDVVMQRFQMQIERLQEHLRLKHSRSHTFGREDIIGHSPQLMRVIDIAAKAASTNATVLIHGETGTGKELLAKAVHFNGARSAKPFVTINCGAIPRELLESELFGHVRGAFTGALLHQRGKVEFANGGTLFLDEIGEMPLELQVKLLRMIQYGEIEKVGATRASVVDVRIIGATHRNLEAMIEAGTFREDLYYRLSVIPIEIPPLRERSDDIPGLVEYFLAKAKVKHGREDLTMSEEVTAKFMNYYWPGNVRELENVVERLVVLARNPQIQLPDLPDNILRGHLPLKPFDLELPPQGISLQSVEKQLMLQALEKFNWNQSETAKRLHISRRALLYRMEKHGISRPVNGSKTL